MRSLEAKNIFLDIGPRFVVGGIFLVAAVSKLPMQGEWVETVVADIIFPVSPIALFYASALPWLELTLGLCLILGLFTRFFSVLSIPIIASFITANALALYYDQFGTCGCLGPSIIISHKVALVIDGLLLTGAIVILFQRKHFMALDSRVPHFNQKLHLRNSRSA